MLVACNFVAAWLGWSAWLVRERRAFVAAVDWDDGQSAPARIDYDPLAKQSLDPKFDSDRRADIFAMVMFDMPRRAYKRYDPTSPPHLSLLRRAFGDAPRLLLAFYPKPGVAAERARWLFPEAIVLVADDPWTPPGSTRRAANGAAYSPLFAKHPNSREQATR
jgi:hypothetical protein